MMAEYITKCNEAVGVSGKALIVPDYIDTSKEIVRCRDCLWSKPEQSDHEYRAERYCNMWIADVSADGFCFRGRRRNVDAQPTRLRGEGECDEA